MCRLGDVSGLTTKDSDNVDTTTLAISVVATFVGTALVVSILATLIGIVVVKNIRKKSGSTSNGAYSMTNVKGEHEYT